MKNLNYKMPTAFLPQNAESTSKMLQLQAQQQYQLLNNNNSNYNNNNNQQKYQVQNAQNPFNLQQEQQQQSPQQLQQFLSAPKHLHQNSDFLYLQYFAKPNQVQQHQQQMPLRRTADDSNLWGERDCSDSIMCFNANSADPVSCVTTITAAATTNFPLNQLNTNKIRIASYQQKQKPNTFYAGSNNFNCFQQTETVMQTETQTETKSQPKTESFSSKGTKPEIFGATLSTAQNDDKFTMDASEIANFLANELFMQQLVSLDGIQSGVPTLTTPTLTPTTLRSIEESFLQLTNEPLNAPYQAGFKPPPLAPLVANATTTVTTPPISNTFSSGVQEFSNIVETDDDDSQRSWNPNDSQLHDDNTTTDTSSAATDSTSYQNGYNSVLGNSTLSTSNSANNFSAVIAAAKAACSIAKNSTIFATTNNHNTSNSATTSTPPRRGGGRRPTKSTNMTPEEEEKRRIRRERNKLAAARCRKRRVDQTNDLLIEVAGLEKKREDLQKDIEVLTATKQQLEYVLDAHRPTCQKVRDDLLGVTTYNGLITTALNNNHNSNSNDSSSDTITGLDPTLTSTGRCNSPIDLKPVIIDSNILHHIKNEPLDSALDSGSSLDHDGPSPPKRMLLNNKNPMVTPLPNIATLTASLTTQSNSMSGSLNTPIVTAAPVNFGSFLSNNCTNSIGTTNTALNVISKSLKQRPNSLPTVPRSFGQLHAEVSRAPTEIQGVPIQTPSTGMFNFDSLMDGGTGLTPVSGPLVPTCSSQNKHPLELQTPTSEPSKLVSL